MFAKSSDMYDLLYSFKDYRKESKKIIDLIKVNNPGSKTILDICCGTGEHHKYLKNEYLIDGLDLNHEFIKLAKVKNSSGTYHIGDMTKFNLNKQYDVLICLFSSIGYVKTFDKLTSTLMCFYQHLKEDGLILIEPWMTPENWLEGKLHMLIFDKDDVKICRMNQSVTEGNLSILNFHYLFGSQEKGVNSFEERHELALFTKEEMKKAFNETNFEVMYEEHGITGRGLYYARKKNVTIL